MTDETNLTVTKAGIADFLIGQPFCGYRAKPNRDAWARGWVHAWKTTGRRMLKVMPAHSPKFTMLILYRDDVIKKNKDIADILNERW